MAIDVAKAAKRGAKRYACTSFIAAQCGHLIMMRFLTFPHRRELRRELEQGTRQSMQEAATQGTCQEPRPQGSATA